MLTLYEKQIIQIQMRNAGLTRGIITLLINRQCKGIWLVISVFLSDFVKYVFLNVTNNLNLTHILTKGT